MRCAAVRWRRYARCRSALYYGSVDSTPYSSCSQDFISSAPATSTPSLMLWPAIEAALDWIDGPGDPDGDGFVEYMRASEQGLANQGWKDLLRRDFSRRRSISRRRDRSGRSAGLRLRGEAHGGTLRAAHRPWRRGARARRSKRRHLAARFEAAFWCAQIEHLRIGSRWRQRSRALCAHRMRAKLVHWHCRSDTGRSRRQGIVAAGLFLGLGNPHGGAWRGSLQSDVVSQRLGLAARQRADCARLRPLRFETAG